MPEIKTKSPKADQDYVSKGTPDEKDERGRRKMDPSVQRQIKKATGELPDSVGQPKVTGDDESAAFKKAHELIEKLKTSKDFEKDF
jgi:hypothetical protein